MSKTPHLKELFAVGRETTVVAVDAAGESTEYKVWLRRPTAAEYEQALTKAKGKQGRVKAKYRDRDSDEYMGIISQVDDESKESLIDALLAGKEVDFKQMAHNELLHGEDKEWGEEGEEYLGLYEAAADRLDEIKKFNEGLSPEDQDLKLDPSEDEELTKIHAALDKMHDRREELVKHLMDKERAELQSKTMEQLREMTIRRIIELESNMAFYSEFKMLMLFFACRMPENKRERYFDSPDDIFNLPEFIRMQLMAAYEELEIRGDDLKNLLSPPSSSAS